MEKVEIYWEKPIVKYIEKVVKKKSCYEFQFKFENIFENFKTLWIREKIMEDTK